MLFNIDVLLFLDRRRVIGWQQIHGPTESEIAFSFPVVDILLSFIGVSLIHFLNEIVQVLCLSRQVVLEQLLKIKLISLLRHQLNLILLDNPLLHHRIHLLRLLTVHRVHPRRIIRRP